MAAPSARKTTKRPTAPKTTTTPQKAAEKPATATRSYTVDDDVLHYTTKAGFDLVIDLDFPPALIKMAMGADDEDRSDEDQFEIIAATYGDNFKEAYAKMGVLERKRLHTAVFAEFQKAMGTTMGESLGSSRS